MRHRREIAEQENRFQWERRREERRRSASAPAEPPPAAADVDERIAAALSAERQAVIPALRSAVDELFDREREFAKSELVERRRFCQRECDDIPKGK